jgi:hypothetical protein
VGCDARDGTRGNVGEGVCDPRHMIDSRRSRSIVSLTHCEPFEEAEGNGGGTAAGHAGGPGHCWGIIASNCDLSPPHGRAEVGLKDCLMEKYPRHFEIGVCNRASWVLICDHGLG